jgi:hypothetical protein
VVKNVDAVDFTRGLVVKNVDAVDFTRGLVVKIVDAVGLRIARPVYE